MQKRWFAVSRRLLEADLWLAEPFTRGQAWLDLIGLARWRDGAVQIRGRRLEIKRGQLLWSEVQLAKRWRWSRNRVRRFLAELETEQQIEQLKTRLTSVISIVNYGRYQPNGKPDGGSNGTTHGTTDETTNGTTDDTADDTTDGTQKKKEKKEKKVREDLFGSRENNIPSGLLALIDAWNSLGPTIVKPGNGASRDPPSRAVLAGWRRAGKHPELRAGLADLETLLAAIRGAKFCHGKPWFDLPWLFTAKNNQFRLTQILKGSFDAPEIQRITRSTPVPASPGVNYDPSAAVGLW